MQDDGGGPGGVAHQEDLVLVAPEGTGVAAHPQEGHALIQKPPVPPRPPVAR